MAGRATALLANVSLLLVSLAVAAAGTLLLARHFGFDLKGRLAQLRSTVTNSEGVQEAEAIAYVYDSRCGWKLVPHTQIHRAEPGRYDVRVRTNSEGFVDREHALLTDYYRIAFVGDSFTEAYQVEAGRRFSSLTEEYVFRDSHGEKAVEVMNFGTSNWGTAHEYGAIKHFVLKYRPDEVWVFFYAGNDLDDNSPALNGPPMGPVFRYADETKRELADIVFGYPDPPVVMNARRQAQYGPRVSQQEWNAEVLPYFYSEAHHPLMDRTLADTRMIFELIRETLRREQIVFRVVYIFARIEVEPDRWQRWAREARQGRGIEMDARLGESRIAAMLAGLGVDFISLSPLKEHAGELFVDHFSPRGHELVAELLARQILEKCQRCAVLPAR